jgi:predicted PurR-regulated permease PerM
MHLNIIFCMKTKQIQQYSFLLLLMTTTAFFVWMLGSYLIPIFWAIVIATVFYPLYSRIEKMVKQRKIIASLLTIVAIILLLLIPLSLLGGLIVSESLQVYRDLTLNSENSNNLLILDRFEKILAYVEPYGFSKESIMERLRESIATISQFIAYSLLKFTSNTFTFFIYTGIAFYLLFFFFKDAKKLEDLVVKHFPLEEKYERELFKRFSEISRAVMKGTFAIACLQGVLGGVAFWIAGVGNPALWGFAMGVLAIIPAVGPMLVWLPVGIMLISSGSIFAGVFILLVGFALVSLIDEFLRPILVGRASKMHDALTLVSTIAGLTTFGISGFVAGPILAAFFVSLWSMFKEEYKTM